MLLLIVKSSLQCATEIINLIDWLIDCLIVFSSKFSSVKSWFLLRCDDPILTSTQQLQLSQLSNFYRTTQNGKKLSWCWQTRRSMRLEVSQSLVHYVWCSFLLCNSNFVFKTEVTQGHWKWYRSIQCPWLLLIFHGKAVATTKLKLK